MARFTLYINFRDKIAERPLPAENGRKLTIVRCTPDADVVIAGTAEHRSESGMFSRSPRIVEPLFDDIIEIEASPAPRKQRDQPLIFVVSRR